MSHSSRIVVVTATLAILCAPGAWAQQAATPAPPVDEAAALAELKQLYAFPVLANECGFAMTEAEFVRLDSAIGIAEERSAFTEEKLDEIYNGVENKLKDELLKTGQDVACKARAAAFKAFVTGLPD